MWVFIRFSHVWLFVTLWIVACQISLSLGFSRQEYWSGLPCPPPGDLHDPGIELESCVSPALQEPSGKPKYCISVSYFYYILVSGDNVRNKWQFLNSRGRILWKDRLHRKPGNRQFHKEGPGSGWGYGGHKRGSPSASSQGGYFQDRSAGSWRE